MPFTTTIVLRLKPGTRQEMERIYRDIFLPGRRELIAKGDLLSTAMIHVGADQESENFLVVSQWASKEAHDRNEDNPHDIESQRAATPYLVAPRSYREVRNPRLETLARHILTYASLVGLLLALFVGCVVTLQWLGHSVTGQSSDLAVVAATLLGRRTCSSLLRRRIRSEIEQRHREPRTSCADLRGVSASHPERGRLDPLSERIITRVHDTVHPAFTSLWIFPVLHHVEDRSLLPPDERAGSRLWLRDCRSSLDPLTAEPPGV